ncbi:MAG TPA: hypothetical protein VII67_04525 [Acidimicrobiales bacterium]
MSSSDAKTSSNFTVFSEVTPTGKMFDVACFTLTLVGHWSESSQEFISPTVGSVNVWCLSDGNALPLPVG